MIILFLLISMNLVNKIGFKKGPYPTLNTIFFLGFSVLSTMAKILFYYKITSALHLIKLILNEIIILFKRYI